MNTKQKYAQNKPESGDRSQTFIGIRYLFESTLFHKTSTVGGVGSTPNPIPIPCRKFEIRQTALRQKLYEIIESYGYDEASQRSCWFEMIKKATGKATTEFATLCGLGHACGCVVEDTPQVRSALIESTEIGVAELVREIELAKSSSFQKYLPPTTPTFLGSGDGHVYLMRDRSNGHTKIGKSIDPGYREKTLRSDKKEIELLFNKLVLKMKHTEDYLHERFKDKRLEGEWFDLSNAEIEEAKSLLKRATKETL